jgi:hypothetical protein
MDSTRKFAFATIVFVVTLHSPSAHGAAGSVPSEHATIDATRPAPPDVLIIGYGDILEAPYEFSAVGGDTLYLNGLAYSPRRRDLPPTIVPPEILERAERRYALTHQVLESVRSMPDGPERWEAYAAGLRESALVRSATAGGCGDVSIVWADGTTAVDLIRRGTSNLGPPPLDAEERHAGLIEEFEEIVGLGGVVAFGDNYFTRGRNPAVALRTREILAQVRSGQLSKPREEEFYRGSLFESPVLRRAILR